MSEHVAPDLDVVVAYAEARHNEFRRRSPLALVPHPRALALTGSDLADKYFRRRVGESIRAAISLVKLSSYVVNAYAYYGANFEELAAKSSVEVAKLVAEVSPDMTLPASRRMSFLNPRLAVASDSGKLLRLAETLEMVKMLSVDFDTYSGDAVEFGYWCTERLQLLHCVRSLSEVPTIAIKIDAAVAAINAHLKRQPRLLSANRVSANRLCTTSC